MRTGYLDDNEFFHWTINEDGYLLVHLSSDITSVTFRIELDYERVDQFVAALQEWAQ